MIPVAAEQENADFPQATINCKFCTTVLYF
jgi:hypothetical protein